MPNTNTSNSSSILKNCLYWLGALAILGGLGLTILSWFGTCTEACEEGHKYRIFGLPFETIGLIYFPLLALAYTFARKSKTIALITGIILAAGLGAEILFILIQRYALYHWCPICLGIAATIALTTIVFAIDYILNLQILLKQGKRQEITSMLKRAVICISALIVGFTASFTGVSKVDGIHVAENNLKKDMVFGKADSNTEIYLFTSWTCPACQKLEPKLIMTIPALMEQSKVIFVDHISDVKTLNFIPYNLAFIMHNKAQYLDMRVMLRDLAKSTDTPTDRQVKKAAGNLSVKFNGVSYADVDMAVDYFKSLSTKYDISSLPAVVIVNTTTNQFKKLSGTADVNKVSIQKAIEELAKDKPPQAVVNAPKA